VGKRPEVAALGDYSSLRSSKQLATIVRDPDPHPSTHARPPEASSGPIFNRLGPAARASLIHGKSSTAAPSSVDHCFITLVNVFVFDWVDAQVPVCMQVLCCSWQLERH
jgi:hypothetical protein